MKGNVMKTVSADIPEQIFLSLQIPEPELQKRLRTELALRLYRVF